MFVFLAGSQSCSTNRMKRYMDITTMATYAHITGPHGGNVHVTLHTVCETDPSSVFPVRMRSLCPLQRTSSGCYWLTWRRRTWDWNPRWARWRVWWMTSTGTRKTWSGKCAIWKKRRTTCGVMARTWNGGGKSSRVRYEWWSEWLWPNTLSAMEDVQG